MEAKDFIGERIEIIGAHPHTGQIGTINKAEHRTSVGFVFTVKLDNGEECIVYKTNNIKFLD